MAGILFASRMDDALPSVGEGWLMGAITAAILGGTRFVAGGARAAALCLGIAADCPCQWFGAYERLGLLATGNRGRRGTCCRAGRSAATASEVINLDI